MEYLDQVKDYWNLRSNGFSSAINEEYDSDLGTKTREDFIKLFGEKPLNILDDGAGPGYYSMLLASLGHHVTSIDYSDNMVGLLSENMRKRGFEPSVIKMDAQNLAFKDASFDAVVQRNVMWNLDHPDKAYSEIFRVLKPGGIFRIDDGNHYLYAHDTEYAEEAEKRKAEYEAMRKEAYNAPGSHGRHNTDNVDFSIIEKIAVQQPLSFERRPQWNLDQMIKLGFKQIDVQIFGNGLPRRFIITARKPE